MSHIEEHSKKPEEARNRIVQLMGDVPRIELFARQSPEGWDVWGNEVEVQHHAWKGGSQWRLYRSPKDLNRVKTKVMFQPDKSGSSSALRWLRQRVFQSSS